MSFRSPQTEKEKEIYEGVENFVFDRRDEFGEYNEKLIHDIYSELVLPLQKQINKLDRELERFKKK